MKPAGEVSSRALEIVEHRGWLDMPGIRKPLSALSPESVQHNKGRIEGLRVIGRGEIAVAQVNLGRAFRPDFGADSHLLRDELLVPSVHRRLRDFYAYLRTIEDVLMAGRGLRGRAAGRTRAAIGHALAFPTWRSLTQEQGLADEDAVALMCLLVEGTGRS